MGYTTQSPRLIKSLRPVVGLPMNGGGFYFIATVLNVEIELPVEIVLTHDPSGKEIGDSISHQLITKISLLSGRLLSNFEYDLFEKNVHSDKIWKLLYSYRSSIAHGNHIDFVKTLRCLSTEEKSVKFLASATRILLRHALREPDLFTGLKPI
jgi:hypothetical protein